MTANMKLIYGTYNPAKVESMKRRVAGLGIEIIGLNEFENSLYSPEESGETPIENATLKAVGYFDQLKAPLFSCDTGLVFEDVAEEDQPGTLVRRREGQSFTYREMLDYYSEMAKRYGGKITAYYKNAICLVLDDETIISYDGEDLWSERFYVVDKPHEIYNEGFPLDSLSVEINSNQYYYDLETGIGEPDLQEDGFVKFFRRIKSEYNEGE